MNSIPSSCSSQTGWEGESAWAREVLARERRESWTGFFLAPFDMPCHPAAASRAEWNLGRESESESEGWGQDSGTKHDNILSLSLFHSHTHTRDKARNMSTANDWLQRVSVWSDCDCNSSPYSPVAFLSLSFSHFFFFISCFTAQPLVDLQLVAASSSPAWRELQPISNGGSSSWKLVTTGLPRATDSAIHAHSRGHRSAS